MAEHQTELKNVYAVCGADEFLKRQAIERLSGAVSALGGGATRYDGDGADVAAILDDVRTYSLLGDRRMVIVEEADSFITKYRTTLEKYCSAPSDSGTLVLCCRSMPANTRLYKIIAQSGEVVRCEPLKGTAVNEWIAQHCRNAYGKQVDSQAAWLLRDLVGTDLDALDAELSKLAVFVSDRPRITVDDIQALVGRHREEDVFGVIDAMMSGETAKALAQWEQVLATDRAAPARAIGGLAWGIRRLLELKIQADAGTSLQILSRQAFTSPDVLRRRLDRVTVASLQVQLSHLLEADLGSKTGLGSVPSAVERFIVRHSTQAPRFQRTA